MAYAERRDGKLTGRWMGRVRVKGKQFQAAFDSKRAAEGYEVYCRLMGDEPPTRSGGSGRTFAEAAEACREAGGPRGLWKAGRDRSNLQRLEYLVGKIGHYDLAEVDKGVLEEVVKDLSRRPARNNASKRLSGASVNRYLHTASAVLTYAVSRGWLDRKIKLPKQIDSKARQETLSPEQEDAIVGVMLRAGHRAEAICVRFLAASGLRPSEMRRLSPTQVEVVQAPGEGGEQIEIGRVILHGDQTKNDTPRMVYIPAPLARDFRALLASEGLPKDHHLRRKFKRAAKECGHPDSIVIYSLRHSTATRLLDAGVDLQVTQEIMGHKDIRTTLGYRHVADKHKLEAAQKMAALRGQSVPGGTVVRGVFEKKAL